MFGALSPCSGRRRSVAVPVAVSAARRWTRQTRAPLRCCMLFYCDARNASGRAKQASLAQSAERLHGKEKVNGSIPLGGSQSRSTIRTPRTGVGAIPGAKLVPGRMSPRFLGCAGCTSLRNDHIDASKSGAPGTRSDPVTDPAQVKLSLVESALRPVSALGADLRARRCPHLVAALEPADDRPLPPRR